MSDGMPTSEIRQESGAPRAGEAGWYDRFYTRELSVASWHRYAAAAAAAHLAPGTAVLEIGCGQGHLLRNLVERGLVTEGDVTAIDQSQVAVEHVRRQLPSANVAVGDAYRLAFPDRRFDACFLLEVIEHFSDPDPALAEIQRVLKPGGRLYLSFPNYNHLLWLGVRVLAEMTDHPNWICLQPIDRIYGVASVQRRLARAGFDLERGVGTGYGPPLLYRWERDWMTNLGNRLGLWRMSFHPVLVFRRRP